MAALPGGIVCVATDHGMVWLEQQTFTLATKAALMQAMLPRHDRHGLVAGCALSSFGNTSIPLRCVDDDNNGLWTAVVAAAELFRYSVTKDPAAAASARRFLNGMYLLHNVTGVRGLYARSACAPDDVGCATERATLRRSCTSQVTPGCCQHEGTCGLQWRNSTAAGYDGWVWKSDTSSDETCGHFFAFAIAAQLAPTLVRLHSPILAEQNPTCWSTQLAIAHSCWKDSNQLNKRLLLRCVCVLLQAERTTAAETVADMLDYMLANDYSLADWTGYATTWGRWAPQFVNGYRPFSDERGLQSLQMLAFISAAQNVSALLPDTAARTARRERWAAAYDELTNSTNGYDENMLNTKIEAPIDDNYSDDQLTYMPYYTYLTTSTDPLKRAAALASLTRTWQATKAERSDLWAAVYMVLSGTRHPADLGSLRWNLQTWPLELINWNTSNAQRIDLWYVLYSTY